MTGRKHLGLASALVIWSALAPAAVARVEAAAPGTIPDSTEMASLRRQIASVRTVRLVGSFGVREIRRPLVDSAGVFSADWMSRSRRRPAIFVTPDAPHEPVPAPIAWSEISQVQSGRSLAGRGAVVGLVMGTWLSAAVVFGAPWLRDSTDEGSVGAAGAVITGGMLTGALVGALFGASRGRWRTLYRTHAQEKS